VSDTFTALALKIEETPLSLAMAESAWLFPTVESLHVIGLTLVVGSIAIVDLRLLGLASRSRAPQELFRAALPVTWGAFLVAAITGLLLFAAKPTSYLGNPFFLAKIALLALAGLNMAAFHRVLEPQLAGAPGGPAASVGVRVAAGTSLALWTAIVVCGRWIGFSI